MREGYVVSRLQSDPIHIAIFKTLAFGTYGMGGGAQLYDVGEMIFSTTPVSQTQQWAYWSDDLSGAVRKAIDLIFSETSKG